MKRKTVTVHDALKGGRLVLGRTENREIFTPELDASLLLADVLKCGRGELFASPERPLSVRQRIRYRRLVRRRANGVPVAYLRGYREFYGRAFQVGGGVLIPRPDTETLVEYALSLIDIYSINSLWDICAGSGAVGLTLALERPGISLFASDCSRRAAVFFKRNRKALEAENVCFFHSNLFGRTEKAHGRQGKVQMITVNPPYLTTAEYAEKQRAGWREPALALSSGKSGLDLIRRIVAEAPAHLSDPALLLLEAAPSQMDSIKEMMDRAGFGEIETRRDLADRERVIKGRLPPPDRPPRG